MVDNQFTPQDFLNILGIIHLTLTRHIIKTDGTYRIGLEINGTLDHGTMTTRTITQTRKAIMII